VGVLQFQRDRADSRDADRAATCAAYRLNGTGLAQAEAPLGAES
jgi:hypothetical protein